MATIRQMENRALQARDSIEVIMLKIIDEYKRDIIELNTQDQLFEQGITTKGEIIGTYSWWTEEFYGGRTKNPPKMAGEPYHFKDSGNLFSGWTIEFNEGNLRLFSTDWKADMWEDRIKSDGLLGKFQGLTIDNEMVLNYEFIKPELIMALKKILYG